MDMGSPMKLFTSLTLGVCLLGAALTGACAVNDNPGDDPTSNNGAGPTTGGGGAGTGAGNTGGGFNEGGTMVPMGYPIMIDPPTFELDVDGPGSPSQPITATINGQDVTDLVTWSFDKPYIGDMEDGSFVPTGNAGGVGVLTAIWGTSFGQATATVNTVKVVGAAGIDPDVKAALDNPSASDDPTMDWMYPYDDTVYPLDVLGPELMWNGVQNGDVYKLHIQETFLEYTEYFTVSTPARHLLSEDDWKNITLSGVGAQSDPLSVSLTRYSGGTAYQPVEKTWRIAQGKLKGIVYYWELPDACGGGDNGRILSLKPSQDQAVEFYQPGGCWGCHTVSRNGKKMMATLDTGLPFPQITVDLTDPAQPGSITQAAQLGGTFSAFNDKGDRIIVSNDDASGLNRLLTIVDGTTGGALAGNVMGTGCGEPAWSPDGTKLAAICGLGPGGWIFDTKVGHLSTADVAADGFTVSNVQTIVPQAGAQGRPAYPSFAPGSELIAYGRPTEGSRSTGDGTLWLTDLTGTNVKELVRASDDNRSFNPVFAPLRAGGYFWLVYISRRDYGNRLVGADRQQIWITAIDDPADAEDPSNPPFYMRGQQDCGKSENAYFALEPCKELGAKCESGADCCNGTCLTDPDTGEYACGEPQECALEGNACKTADDCCNPAAQCVDGFCETDVPE